MKYSLRKHIIRCFERRFTKNKADKSWICLFILDYSLLCIHLQDTNLNQMKLNSYILGSSMANLSIRNLRENVEFTLMNKQPVAVCVRTYLTVHHMSHCHLKAVWSFSSLTLLPQGNYVAVCVFWDFDKNGELNKICELSNFLIKNSLVIPMCFGFSRRFRRLE